MSDHEHEEAEPLQPIEGLFTDLFAANMEPPKWIIRDLLPPGLVFVGAPPKSGKSTIEMAIALLVAGYRCDALPPFLSVANTTGPVMGFSAEATAGELRHMVEEGMKVKGEPNGSVLICDDPFQWRLDDKNGLEQLMLWLDERKPKLVFIDPLRDFHSMEEKDSGEMNRLLRPLQRWAKKNESAVMIVHHAKKLQEDTPGRRYTPDDLRGTSALFGIADAVLMITPSGKNDGVIHMHATFKRAKAWERTFRLGAYDWAGTPGREEMAPMDLQAHKAVQLGCRTAKEVAEHLHVPIERAKEMLQKLQRNGMVKLTKKGWKPCPKK